MPDEQRPEGEPWNNRDPSPRRSGGKPTGLPALSATTQGEKTATRLGQRLAILFEQSAPIRAHRRRATAIDTIDYEAAFDDMVGPGLLRKRFGILADVATLFGGGFLGYAINLMTGDKPATALIVATMLSGLLLGIGAIAIKSRKLD